MTKRNRACVLTLCGLVLAASLASADGYENTSTEVETTIGTLEFKGGYPTASTVEKAFDQLDIQRATQAYLEFMPMMSMNSIFEAHISDYGWESPSDIQIYIEQGKGKAGAIGLTYNTESIYASAHTDLKMDGPTVVEMPT
jgi:hypothetical protein